MNIKLTVNLKHAERGFADIQKANEVAAKNTLNTIAALTRKNSIERIKADFTLRNNFTEKSIAYDRVKSNLALKDMESVVGALKRAEYLKLLHEGGIRKPKAMFKGVAIPQQHARGGSKKRLVRESFYLQILKEKRVTRRMKITKIRFKSKKAQTVARAFVANKEKLFMKYKEGYYSVSNFLKNKNNISFRMKKFYSMPKKNPVIRKNSWLWDSAKKPAADAQNIYNSQFKKMLRSKKII